MCNNKKLRLAKYSMDSVNLILGDVLLEVCYNCLDETFNLATGLGMIQGSCQTVDVQMEANCCQQFGYKLQSVFELQNPRNSVQDNPLSLHVGSKSWSMFLLQPICPLGSSGSTLSHH